MIKKFFNAVKESFTALLVIVDESKNINEDGSWDEYWARKNRKAEK